MASIYAHSPIGAAFPATSAAVLSALGLPPSLDAIDAQLLQLCGLLLLVFLMALIALRLQAVRDLVLPEVAASTSLADVPGMLVRKARLVGYGAIFLILSKDKVSKADLKRAAAAHAAAAPRGPPLKTVRIIFMRHGESVWNYVFNRGFQPSFLLRLLATTLKELYLIPWEDSAYIDSPLSELGVQQCTALQRFLRKPCLDPRAQKDYDAVTRGEGSLLVSSHLRRAAATALVSLSDRLAKSREPVHLHSSCQEISRNFDTLSLTPSACAPKFGSDLALEISPNFDAACNRGNKSLSFGGYDRLLDFAQWAADRPEPTIIITGHSLWFRSFFQVFLPPSCEHVATKRKIVNCGVVGFDLQVGPSKSFSVDPDSIVVTYGGFASK